MAQYKASMERMFDEEKDKPSNNVEDEEKQHQQHPVLQLQSQHPILSWLEKHAPFLMMPVLPLLWCCLFLSTMDRQLLLSSYAMPLLGIVAATLANAVPVGGGIVFVPILSLVGYQLHLGAAFAVATMTFGNGIFGFLSWLQKDPSNIAWPIVPYAVIPAWIGAVWGMTHPFLTARQSRQLFAVFCLNVALVVVRGLYYGRTHHNQGDPNTTEEPKDETVFTVSQSKTTSTLSLLSLNQRIKSHPNLVTLACGCSFLAGLVLVSHIGIGNAMTTFLVCRWIWKLPAKPSVVTGILVGGWTSVVPFGLHLFVLGDVPIALWVMGLPGVYLGARIAPLVHEQLGITTVLAAFCCFLVGTAVLMLST